MNKKLLVKCPVETKRLLPLDIKSARLEKGLTQNEAATLVYRSVRNWQQFESGDRKMDPAIWELFQLKSSKRQSLK